MDYTVIFIRKLCLYYFIVYILPLSIQIGMWLLFIGVLSLNYPHQLPEFHLSGFYYISVRWYLLISLFMILLTYFHTIICTAPFDIMESAAFASL